MRAFKPFFTLILFIRLFQGAMENQEIFLHLLIHLERAGESLYAALYRLFSGQRLMDLPQFLQIQVQRVQYDRDLGRAVKSNLFFQIPERLNLATFTKSKPDEEFCQKLVQENRLLDELNQSDQLLKTLNSSLDNVALLPALKWISTLMDTELKGLASEFIVDGAMNRFSEKLETLRTGFSPSK